MTGVYMGSGGGVRVRRKAKGTPRPDAPFLWSGKFPFPANSSAELVEYLGIDGSVSPALPSIPNASHLWQAEAVPSLDVGPLADAAIYDFASQGTPPGVTTHPDFGQGARAVLEHTTELQALQVSGPSRIPNPMDATKSFLIGGIMRWDSFPGAEALYNVVTRYVHASTMGWLIYVNRTGADERKLILQFTRGPGFTTLVLPDAVAIPFGTPFAWLCNVDFQSGLMKVVTSEAGSYAQGAVPGSGTFDPGDAGQWVGNVPIIPGLNLGFVGQWAQMFSFEYPSTFDAQISAANMLRFLEYCDGFRTV